jgi:uncharacterized membrane protein
MLTPTAAGAARAASTVPPTSDRTLGNQRPPGEGPVPSLPPPPHAYRRARAEKRDVALARALGWFSVGLGAAELAAPRSLARAVGSGRDHATIARLAGARELACGIGLLQGRSPQVWLWARVAGDLMDLAMLGMAMGERRSRRGQLAMAAGAVAAVTALDLYAARRWSGRDMPRQLPDTGVVDVQRSITINKPPQACYDAWHRFEDLPRFMRHLDSVTTVRPGVTHWVAKAPFGATVEWDAEVTNDQPGQLIAWRSVDESDVEQTGVVRFEPGPRNGTVVHVEMHYRPPAGRMGAAVATLFGDEPTQAVLEDLRRFKRLMETGEVPTTDGQPHGRRGVFYQLMRRVHTR